MADKRSVGHAYNIDFLNVVFAVSSLFVLVTTVWMVWDDYDREWKDYQRRFVQLETEVALGEDFNEKAFNDFLLGQGIIPLELMAKAVREEFIPSQQ